MELPRLDVFSATLPLNGSLTFPLSGDFVFILRAGGEVNLKIDNASEGKRLTAGAKFRTPRGTQFQSLTFENMGPQAEDLRFAYGVGDFDAKLSDAAPNFNSFTTLACPNGVSTQAWLSGQTDRRAAILSAPSTNTGPVWVQDSNVGAAEGIELLPGEKLVLPTSAQIWIWNGSGAAQNVGRSELQD